MTSSTDRIEKRVMLRAPHERVWRAVSDSEEFGNWFGLELDGRFTPGAQMRGRLKPTIADADIAKMQEKYAGHPLALYVDQIEPMSTFSFRWHPFALDPAVDYSSEPMTLVTFTLEAVEGGTLLTITESGFDAVPLARRADAFEANEEGWAMMTGVIEKYLHQQRS